MANQTNEQCQLQLLRFYLGQDCYCLDTADVAAIRRWEETVPASEELRARAQAVIAVVPFGGQNQNVPVYSLRERLGLESGGDPAGPVIVVRSARHAYGVQADRVARAVSVAATEPRRLPAAAQSPAGKIRGAVALNAELALYLSVGKLAPVPSGLVVAADRALGEPECWLVNPPAAAQQRLLCFSEPGGDTSMMFGFTLRQVVEIAQGQRVVRLTAGNPCTIGVMQWRGHVVPVIDPGALLGVYDGAPDLGNSRFAILRGSRSNDLFAIPATGFAALSLPIDPAVGTATPMMGLGPYVRAAFVVDNGCLVLPDLDRISLAHS